MATIRATGASLLNTVDINANNISVFDNKQSKYININKVYVHDSQIIEATENENKKYEFPSEDINDNNISGLHSMINYINTHTGKKPNYFFTKIIQILISKRKQIILRKDIHMMNQIFTIKLQKQFLT